MNTKYGGSAFPSFAPEINGAFFPGMTLRDYFAGQALTGMIKDRDAYIAAEKVNADAFTFIASMAYASADAMLAAREAKQ